MYPYVIMVVLLVGLVLGIILIIALILKYTSTSKLEYVQFHIRCKHCGDETNGLKCPRCENR